ncbi:MAG: beta galactosidase jelly roll domain-containing protein [Asticcacaulis sp.]|nr:beta galactosidase jelly roll domain-containing protein [Asticcacaulis sp.]
MSIARAAAAVFAASLAMPALAFAETPRFAGIFGDHAVLQRDSAIKVWGTATPGATLTVARKDGKVTTTAGSDGRWQASLPATGAGGPYALSVSDGTAATTLNDILVGDVYLCSGQSNMEFQVKYASSANGEINGSANDQLRFINIDRASAAAPAAELVKPAPWQVVGPQTVGDASAVCYYMAKSISTSEKVPVGMIDSYWGGTVIQAWISEPGLRAVKTYDSGLDALKLYATAPDQAKEAWAQATRDTWKSYESDIDAKVRWVDPKFKDADWKTITPDGIWENSDIPDLANFDGIVWYRTTVTLTKAQVNQAAQIHLGPVDDIDITWINGVMVGTTSAWDAPRDYAIPAGTLKAGKNVIVVRAVDTGGGGGMWGKPADRRITFADGSAQALPAAWKYKISGPILPGANIAAEPWASPNGLTDLYNAMIAPLTPYSLKGVAWYQGEANVSAPEEYQTLLATMMADWRTHFDSPALPFLIVQLSAYGPVAKTPVESNWARLRQSQNDAVAADGHAALAVSVDVGDRTDIHPTQKKVVGDRLARAASAVIYGKPVSPGGPVATGVTVSGDDLIVAFKDTQGALVTYSSDMALGFESCAADKTCRFVPAIPDGDKIILQGAAPGAVDIRYAWADSPIVNLFSQDDLPAVPFAMKVGQ